MTPTPNFGRAWKITLATRSGSTIQLSSDQFAEPLRVKFSVETRALLAYWTAEVSIYNVNAATSNAATSTGIGLSPDPNQLWMFNQPIQFGDNLSISAGYKYASDGTFDPDANLIWTGNVLQPLWTRENVVDYKITLRCLLGLLQDAINIPNAPSHTTTGISVAANASDYDTLQQVATAARIPLDAAHIDVETLQNSTAVRGKVLTGRPFPLIAQIAKPNGLQTWLGPSGLQMRSLTFNPNTIPAYAYGPPDLPGSYAPKGTTTGIIKKTLLGVPEQTQQGVTFRVLLDAMPQIGDIVQLAPNTAINRIPINIGQFPAILDSGGLYVVAGIRHVGDSRGNDWYTEITGLTHNFFDIVAAGLNVTG